MRREFGECFSRERKRGLGCCGRHVRYMICGCRQGEMFMKVLEVVGSSRGEEPMGR